MKQLVGDDGQYVFKCIYLKARYFFHSVWRYFKHYALIVETIDLFTIDEL